MEFINKPTVKPNPHGDFYTAPKPKVEQAFGDIFKDADEGNDAINNAVLDEKNQSEKAGGFFVVNLKQIDSMVARGASADDVLAYLVLSKGINKKNDIQLTSYGAQAVYKRTGMAYTRAESAIQWLLGNGYIEKAEGEGIPAQLGKGTSRKHKPRWVLTQVADIQSTALANALVEGIGRGRVKPPLMRIYNEISLGKHCIIADSRLDSVMVLVHLYWHHHFADCGGINPRDCLYRNWEGAENVTGEKVVDIDGTNAALYEIKSDLSTVFNAFANEALFYIEDETERYARFWEAFNNIKSLGLLYEVIQIWDSNPNGSNGKNAEPLYTLYIYDRHARESEPYLQKAIHKFAFKTGAMDRYTEFIGWDYGESNLQSGQLRYIATRKKGGYPIGIYRLRFRPHTPDTGIGMAAETKRVGEWANNLKSLVNDAF
jgi:hypothetical protein